MSGCETGSPLADVSPLAAAEPLAAEGELADELCPVLLPEALVVLLLPEPPKRLPIKSLTFGSTDTVSAARVTASD
jgi:hypothetical protein